MQWQDLFFGKARAYYNKFGQEHRTASPVFFPSYPLGFDGRSFYILVRGTERGQGRDTNAYRSTSSAYGGFFRPLPKQKPDFGAQTFQSHNKFRDTKKVRGACALRTSLLLRPKHTLCFKRGTFPGPVRPGRSFGTRSSPADGIEQDLPYLGLIVHGIGFVP